MTEYFLISLQGFFTGAGLIIAIGAQNAFVLTQSIRRNHAFAVAGLCAALDAILITVGVCGLGTLVANNEILRAVATFGGAAFLLWFGLRSFLQARQPIGLAANATVSEGLWSTLSATLAISLLNPHVYLDTVIMLGSISGNYPGPGRYFFGLGAATASIIWFFTLCLAGRALAPVFSKPRSWQLLHLLVALMVWWVAAGLLLEYFTVSA